MEHSNDGKSNIKILIDTNVILDVMMERMPFFNDSKRIMTMCSSLEIQGYLAVHSIPTLWYLMRKGGTDKMVREFMVSILSYLDISGINKDMILRSLSRENFSDFEDCLQDECAFQIEADYIVTRNKKDFENSKIPVVLPEEFISKVEVELQ